TLALTGVTMNASGNYRVRVTNPVGAASSPAATLRVVGPPAFLEFTNTAVAIDEDTPTPTLSFRIGDPDTPATSLTLHPSSSHPALVPAGHVVFALAAGDLSGSNRTVRLSPATNLFGDALITVTVRDPDNLIAQQSIALTVRPVNDPPTITHTTNQTTLEN